MPHDIKPSQHFINSISKVYTRMITRRLGLPGRLNNEKWTAALLQQLGVKGLEREACLDGYSCLPGIVW